MQRARRRTDSTPAACVRGIPIHEDEFTALVQRGRNLGAKRRGQREEGARDHHCNWDAVLVHGYSFRQRFSGLRRTTKQRASGKAERLASKPQRKDTHTAKKEASSS